MTLADELCQISLGPHKKDVPHHLFRGPQQGIRSQRALPAVESHLFYKPITWTEKAEELAHYRDGNIQLKGQVLTGQINPTKSGNIHLLKPLVYFLLWLLTFLTYVLRYSPSQQFPQNLTPRESAFLHPTVKCSPSPRDLNPKIWGTIAIFIANIHFCLLLWALFIFTQSTNHFVVFFVYGFF